MSSIDSAISFTASSPVTGSTGWLDVPPEPPGPPEPPEPPEPEPPAVRGAGEAGGEVGVVAGGVVGPVGPGVVALVDGDVEPDGSAPGRNDECESECDASRIATLSNATVSTTRRLNRISSTRNALVCTIQLHHASGPTRAICTGESRPP